MIDAAFDFVHSFPMPNDAEMHRAGRLGLLDQKEDCKSSDQEWIAFQHRCWIGEFQSVMQTIGYLKHCISSGLDPATAERPRGVARWPHIEQLMRKEIASQQGYLEGLFESYSGYFGDEAARVFRAFLETAVLPPESVSTQPDLFANLQE